MLTILQVEEKTISGLYIKYQRKLTKRDQYWKKCYFSEVGKQTFLSAQIANPQILGFIPLWQIRKFPRYASPQISNLQSFITYPQIGKFIPNTAQLCLKTVLNFVFANVF